MNQAGRYSGQELLQCLKLRLDWYMKAFEMCRGTIPLENGFNWPPYFGDDPRSMDNLVYFRGAIAELKNTINMMES